MLLYHPKPAMAASGFTKISLIVVIVVVVVLSTGIYLWSLYQNQIDPRTAPHSSASSCSADLFQCPNGALLERDPNTCKFPDCPSPSSQANQTPSNWQTFDRYGLRFSYPRDWQLESLSGDQNTNLGLIEALTLKNPADLETFFQIHIAEASGSADANLPPVSDELNTQAISKNKVSFQGIEADEVIYQNQQTNKQIRMLSFVYQDRNYDLAYSVGPLEQELVDSLVLTQKLKNESVESISTQDWVRYRDSEYNFTFDYPPKYQAIVNPEELTGWDNAITALYDGGQSFDLVIQTWESAEEIQAEYPEVVDDLTVIQLDDFWLSFLNVNQEPDIQEVIQSVAQR